MTQMLRQCVSPKQKDWVAKLPAIEFAMNSARSSTTGFTPFYLNYGRNPSPMIWRGEEQYPGVRQFADNMKAAIMSAHDAIIASRVQHTVQANRKRLPANFKEGDLVYLSTKNISMPKGRARKLAPKYLGPFPITKIIKEGATYQLGLSDELIKRGVNKSFHASLLRPHVPNDDRWFPGRLPIQIPGFGEKPEEWIVERIITHHGKGLNSEFQILWKAGDKSWATHRETAHLIALDRYCELMGVGNASELPANYVKFDDIPEDHETKDAITKVHACDIREWKKDKREDEDLAILSNSSSLISISPLTTHSIINMTGSSYLKNLKECLDYQGQLDRAAEGRKVTIGPTPPGWSDYVRKSRDPRLRDSRNDQINYPTTSPAIVTNDSVSMPAKTLDAIIRSINTRPVHPTPVPKPVVITRYVKCPPPTPPKNNYRGFQGKGRGGGYNGRGGYKGKARGRGGFANGPARNNNNNATYADKSVYTETDANPIVNNDFPVASTSTSNVIDNTLIEPVTEWDLDFLGEFAKADISVSAEITEDAITEDAPMDEPAAEENPAE